MCENGRDARSRPLDYVRFFTVLVTGIGFSFVAPGTYDPRFSLVVQSLAALRLAVATVRGEERSTKFFYSLLIIFTPFVVGVIAIRVEEWRLH